MIGTEKYTTTKIQRVGVRESTVGQAYLLLGISIGLPFIAHNTNLFTEGGEMAIFYHHISNV